ncbi:ankyrin repeat domain-containing protein [Kordia sp. YSTF-M3]|uniref:Ankyrin repeat domain-containing protein n=1 Tax=Kordia aestuariivivens TaxID=2759037 RepID=A0ABR7Q4L7_9FLAO|nr:ankyrin repeat domain-containing protein [Kordia aestuariivivens]MBC8753485.1 ankyrin repeat domain-containing protein [Kordia aestuariivivens]
MKKTIFMIALIVGASFTTANATEGNNETATSNEVTVTTVVKVNPFCIAIAKGDFDTVKKMIQFGENVNKTSNGKTPLMYAARYNRVEIASLLLKNGAKLDSKDKNGHTAIDYAKLSKALDVKKVLVEASK